MRFRAFLFFETCVLSAQLYSEAWGDFASEPLLQAGVTVMLRFRWVFLCLVALVLFACAGTDDNLCEDNKGCEPVEEVCKTEGGCFNKQPGGLECDCLENEICDEEGVCILEAEDEECHAEKACSQGYACKAGEGGAKNTCVELNPNGCQSEAFACTTENNRPYCTTTDTPRFPKCADKPEGVECGNCLPDQVCYVFPTGEGDGLGSMCAAAGDDLRNCFNSEDIPLCPVSTGRVCRSYLDNCGFHSDECIDKCPDAEGDFCYVNIAWGRDPDTGENIEDREVSCKPLEELPENCKERFSTCNTEAGEVCGSDDICFIPVGQGS